MGGCTVALLITRTVSLVRPALRSSSVLLTTCTPLNTSRPDTRDIHAMCTSTADTISVGRRIANHGTRGATRARGGFEGGCGAPVGSSPGGGLDGELSCTHESWWSICPPVPSTDVLPACTPNEQALVCSTRRLSTESACVAGNHRKRSNAHARWFLMMRCDTPRTLNDIADSGDMLE